MRYMGLIEDDIVDGDNGICVSLWMAGCPHRCKGCHNPETWNYKNGEEIDRNELINKIKAAINKYGITRNFSILGGEPLAPFNIEDTKEIVLAIRKEFPNIQIYLWTGYVYEQIKETAKDIFDNINVLIDGPYIEALRKIEPLKGSSNQRIIKLK